jgi:hypothetical protein
MGLTYDGQRKALERAPTMRVAVLVYMDHVAGCPGGVVW